MSQSRLIEFGAPVTYDRIQRIVNSLVGPCILSGGEFYVPVGAPNLLGIAPFSIVLQNGLVLIEDEQQEKLDLVDINPQNYTIVYTYDNTQGIVGGVSAQLEAKVGLYTQNQILDGTVMGWVKYPGNNKSLTTSMFYQPLRVRLGAPDTLDDLENLITADWPSVFQTESLAGAATTANYSIQTRLDPDNFLYQSFNNQDPINVAIASYISPVVVKSSGLGCVFVEAKTDTAQLAIELLTSSTTVVPINSVLTNLSTFTQQLLNIQPSQYSLFSSLDSCLMRIVVSVPPNAVLSIKTLGVSSYRLPFIP